MDPIDYWVSVCAFFLVIFIVFGELRQKLAKVRRWWIGGRWAFEDGEWWQVHPDFGQPLGGFLKREGYGTHWTFQGILCREDYIGKRWLCKIGWHRWMYIPNEHGGKPMQRVCECCERYQVWDYDAAREHGVIRWINTGRKWLKENYPRIKY